MPKRNIEDARSGSFFFREKAAEISGRDKTKIERIARVVEEQLGLTRLSPSYLHLILAGERPAPPKLIEALVNGFYQGRPDEEAVTETDRLLILAGHAPATFRHIEEPDANGYRIVAKGRKRELKRTGEDAPSVFNENVKLLSRRREVMKLIVEGAGVPEWHIFERSVILLDRVENEMELEDGDVGIVCNETKGVLFVTFEKKEGRLSAKDTKGKSVRLSPESDKILGRITLIYQPQITSKPSRKLTSKVAPPEINIGIAPFQDALLPKVGEEFGWYEEEGLNVKCIPTAWHDWGNFFDIGEETGKTMVLFSNIFSFLSNSEEWRANGRELVFFYGVNYFDRGFALLARSDALQNHEKLKSNGGNEKEVILKILQQLEGESISTIGDSDWAAQMYSLAKTLGAGLEIIPSIGGRLEVLLGRGKKPTKIVLKDVGRRTGVLMDHEAIHASPSKYFIGSLPQRIKLEEKGWTTILKPDDIPAPYPVNGFITTNKALQDPRVKDSLLAFLRVWFRIARGVNRDNDTEKPSTMAKIVAKGFRELAKLYKTQKPTILNASEVVQAWAREKFADTPLSIEKIVLDKWEADWDRAAEYLRKLHPEFREVSKDYCRIGEINQEYIRRYGAGKFKRFDFEGGVED